MVCKINGGAGCAILLDPGVSYEISVAQIYRAANIPLMDRVIPQFRGDRGEFRPKGSKTTRYAIAALGSGTHPGLLADQKMATRDERPATC